MTALEQKNSNELFRYVKLNQFELNSLKKIDIKYILQQFNEISEELKQAIQVEYPLFWALYLTMINGNNTQDPNDNPQNLANNYQGKFSNEESFELLFPKLLEVIRYVENNAETMTVSSFKTFTEDQLDTTINQYVFGTNPAPASNERLAITHTQSLSVDFLKNWFRLWDNLIIHTAQLRDPSLMHTASKAIVVLHVLKRIAFNDDFENDVDIFRKAFNATALLPMDTVRLFSEISGIQSNGGNQTANSAKSGDEYQDGSNERTISNRPETEVERITKAKEGYSKYIKAIEEIKSFQDKQYFRGRSFNINPNNFNNIPTTADPNYISDTASEQNNNTTNENSSNETPTTSSNVNLPNVYVLSLEDRAQLSTETNDIISEMVGDSPHFVEFRDILDRLNKKAVDEVTVIAQSIPKELSVRIGNTIIHTNNKEGQSSMSSKYEAKEFMSEGVFASMVSIGDLLVTKQELIKYDLGEVAHVENIMQGEYRERSYRTLDRTEEFTQTEQETETETSNETQTTERFNVEKESSHVLNTEFNFNAGVTFSGKFGTVEFGSNLNTSLAVSTQDSKKEATQFSKDVTTKALKRVKEKVRTLRSKLIIHEVIEETKHGYDNKTNTRAPKDHDHINGVYRWLDKYYLNKVYNYGKRMMMEFAIPEPASFYIHSKIYKPQNPDTIMQKPIHPSKLEHYDDSGNLIISKLTDFTQLTEQNYYLWTSYYGVTDVPLFPIRDRVIGKSYKVELEASGDDRGITDVTFQIPDGYAANMYSLASYLGGGLDNRGRYKGMTRIQIGGNSATLNYTEDNTPTNPSTLALCTLYPIKGPDIIPISIKSWFYGGSKTMTSITNVELICQLTSDGENAWKQTVYAKIMEKYEQDWRDYVEWLKADQIYNDKNFGNNPNINREIERTELKKQCLEMFSGQRFESFDATVLGKDLGIDENDPTSKYPEMLFIEAIKEGAIAKFFEQAFDWDNMTYQFYPYYYGRKQNWVTVTNYQENNDPIFEQFLKAGKARAIVPVRPGYEMLLVLYAGIMWMQAQQTHGQATIPLQLGALLYSGLGVPNIGIHHPLFVSIKNELQKIFDLDEDKPTLIGHYTQKVPTNLVYLAKQHPPKPGDADYDPDHKYPDLPDHSLEDGIVEFLVP